MFRPWKRVCDIICFWCREGGKGETTSESVMPSPWVHDHHPMIICGCLFLTSDVVLCLRSSGTAAAAAQGKRCSQMFRDSSPIPCFHYQDCIPCAFLLLWSLQRVHHRLKWYPIISSDYIEITELAARPNSFPSLLTLTFIVNLNTSLTSASLPPADTSFQSICFIWAWEWLRREVCAREFTSLLINEPCYRCEHPGIIRMAFSDMVAGDGFLRMIEFQE